MTEWQRELLWPCDVAIAIQKVVYEPIENPAIVEAMKDVTSCDVLLSEWRKGVYVTELDVRMNPPVPAALRSLLKPQKMGWVQHAAFTPETGLYDVRVVPHMFANVLKVEKLSRFEAIGPGRSRQAMRFRADCAIPLVGAMMETFILQKLLESLQDQFAKTSAELAQKPAVKAGR